MDFDDYQKQAAKYDLGNETPSFDNISFLEKVLGLAGETGEVVDKIKKVLRDNNGKASEADKAAITKELGDVLWYIASIARYLDVNLSDIAHDNIAKLEDRYQRNLLHGEGDER